MPDGLHDRAQDNWESLIAIADTAGGDWPKLARAAALALSGAVDAADDTRNVQLLSDIRDAFKEDGGDLLTTAALIKKLCAMEDHPWATASRGKPITAQWLAGKLKPFGVKPKQLWTGRNDRGYPLDQFEDPFRRYLADQPARPAITQAGCGSQPFSQPARNPNPSTCENAPKPSPGAGSSGSSAYERCNGGEGVSGDRDTGVI
jgi:Protein of unknown function (DUF3631)